VTAIPAGGVVCACGALVPDVPELRADHLYVGAAPGCWRLYTELIGLETADPGLAESRMLAVDAYMSQHPGAPGRQAAQSLWVHLVGICLALEFGMDGFETARAKAAVAAPDATFEWLQPPASMGALTVRDALAARHPDGHRAAVRRWLESVWEAWAHAHAQIRERAAAVAGDRRP